MKIPRNKLVLIAFAVQIAMLLSIIAVVYGVSRWGQSVSIQMTGHDPYDALRGRYLQLDIPDSGVGLEPGSLERYKTQYETMGNRDIPVYVILDKDPDSGLSQFSFAALDRPGGSAPYIRCPSRYLWTSDGEWRVNIRPRITQYYLNETQAQQLDASVRWDTEIRMRLKIWNGLYVADGIEIDNQDY